MLETRSFSYGKSLCLGFCDSSQHVNYVQIGCCIFGEQELPFMYQLCNCYVCEVVFVVGAQSWAEAPAQESGHSSVLSGQNRHRHQLCYVGSFSLGDSRSGLGKLS